MLLSGLYEKICELIFSYLKKLVVRRKTWGKKKILQCGSTVCSHRFTLSSSYEDNSKDWSLKSGCHFFM